MESNLWKECLNCKDKCCKKHIAFRIFATPQEKEKLSKINCSYPCSYFNKNELCDTHSSRPVDCRFFPFDIMEINKRFFWITWKLDCPIINRRNFEPYMIEHEKNLIPNFTEHLGDYSRFRLKELLKEYKYEVIREVNFN